MTTVDLTLLKSWLEELSLAQLYSLEDAGLPWLPPLQNKRRRRVVNDIIRALQDVTDQSQRLHCVAWLHCWLLPRRSNRPWHVIRFETASVLSNFWRLLSRTATVLRVHGGEVTLAWTVEDGTVFACLLVQNLGALSLDHEALYMVLWPGLPIMALFAPDQRGIRRLLLALDRAMAGAPVQKLDVPCGDLETVEPGTLNVPKVTKDLRDPPAGDKDSKERLDMWSAALAELGPSLRPVDSSYTLTDGKGTWVRFEGPQLLDKLRDLYVRGFDAILSKHMLPAFLGSDYHIV
ncbi:uncharacterized protein [Dermacentor andersoni]|uniref:uncharacterized protein isoform X2 n=1 Tax=Dermacentor andersoni TaxID=34620 RepID=UPI002415C447|nr:uncharacterized protein LOC126529642 isoform X2 [Dermacentor andersoni]